MTQFRVLPVRRGDAYLLMSARGDYLVDGGAPGCGLPEMLEDRKVRKLRAAICSGTSPERLGGIIDLLQSKRKITELWLPDTLEIAAETARRFDGDWHEWVRLASNGTPSTEELPSRPWPIFGQMPSDEQKRRLNGAIALLALGFTLCTGEALRCDSSHERTESRIVLETMVATLAQRASTRSGAVSSVLPTINLLGWQLLNAGTTEDLAVLCGQLMQAEVRHIPGPNHRGARASVHGLALVAQIVALAAKTCAKIRFFRHTNMVEEALVPRHPLRCVNGIEVSPLENSSIDSSASGLYQQTKKIISNNKSLVFQYGDRECSVLFCSDTRLHFLNMNEIIHLDRPTIITAPRQGNPSAERTYAHIESASPKRDIWVRTHQSSAHKIAKSFKKTMNKM